MLKLTISMSFLHLQFFFFMNHLINITLCKHIILFNFQGGTIKWLVKKLRIKLASQNKEMNLYEELSNHVRFFHYHFPT